MREINCCGRDAVMALHINIAGTVFAFLPRPTEPDAAAFFKCRVKRARQATLRTGRAARFGNRHAVRNDYQTSYRTSLQGLDSKPAQFITPTSE